MDIYKKMAQDYKNDLLFKLNLHDAIRYNFDYQFPIKSTQNTTIIKLNKHKRCKYNYKILKIEALIKELDKKDSKLAMAYIEKLNRKRNRI